QPERRRVAVDRLVLAGPDQVGLVPDAGPGANTTKSPSISADILRPAVLVMAHLLSACLRLERHQTRHRITARLPQPQGSCWPLRIPTKAVAQRLGADRIAAARAPGSCPAVSGALFWPATPGSPRSWRPRGRRPCARRPRFRTVPWPR